MIIKIEIQAAEAFDRLTILECKLNSTDDLQIKANIKQQIENLQRQINIAIGYDKAKEIYNSIQYFNLYTSNLIIFDLLDQVNQKKEMDAAVVNDENYRRYICKNELNNKFFNGKLEEIKVGY